MAEKGIEVRLDRNTFEAGNCGDVVSDTVGQCQPGSFLCICPRHHSGRRSQAFGRETHEERARLHDLAMPLQSAQVAISLAANSYVELTTIHKLMLLGKDLVICPTLPSVPSFVL